MKTIIAGSRSITDIATVRCAVERAGWPITEVVSGRAPGVDRLGEQWAREAGVPIKPFPANWRPHGRKGPVDRGAGFARNQAMAEYADALIAVWDGLSSGTRDMIERAGKLGLRVYIYRTDFPGSPGNCGGSPP